MGKYSNSASPSNQEATCSSQRLRLAVELAWQSADPYRLHCKERAYWDVCGGMGFAT